MKCSKKYSEFLSPVMADYIADTQGEIFQFAADKGCDMFDFTMRYMNSAFCNQEMDAVDSYFHYKPDTVCISCLENEFVLEKAFSGTKEMFAPYWVGRVYRGLVLATGLPSRDVVKQVPPERMDMYSISMELCNIEEVIDEIMSICFRDL